MLLTIFYLNPIQMLMMKMTRKQFLFHLCTLRPEGYSTLSGTCISMHDYQIHAGLPDPCRTTTDRLHSVRYMVVYHRQSVINLCRSNKVISFKRTIAAWDYISRPQKGPAIVLHARYMYCITTTSDGYNSSIQPYKQTLMLQKPCKNL